MHVTAVTVSFVTTTRAIECGIAQGASGDALVSGVKRQESAQRLVGSSMEASLAAYVSSWARRPDHCAVTTPVVPEIAREGVVRLVNNLIRRR